MNLRAEAHQMCSYSELEGLFSSSLRPEIALLFDREQPNNIVILSGDGRETKVY
ncbi:hypothetical protein ACFLWU_06305 [Chloroflexota bacterium]